MTLVGLNVRLSVCLVVLQRYTNTLEQTYLRLKVSKEKVLTQTTNITGLSSDPVKAFGSDGLLHANEGVGDVKVDITLSLLEANV